MRRRPAVLPAARQQMEIMRAVLPNIRLVA